MSNLPMTVINTNIENKVLYAISIHVFIDGVEREHKITRPNYKWALNKSRKLVIEYASFFNKFIYAQTKSGLHNYFILDNCFSDLIKRKDELKLNHFLRFDNEVFEPSNHPSNTKELKYVVYYVEVSNSIVSYLLQIGESKLANEVQSNFSTRVKSDLKLGKVLKLKANELWNLDLETYFKNNPRRK